MLTLADLLAEPTLGLEQRAGPDDADERAVLGAAVVEVETPARWIAPGWVLLTAGVRLESCAEEELRELVADCAGAGVAALGFGIGPVFDDLPEPLLDEAAKRAYPVFSIPRDTPFRDVVRHVDAAIMGDEAPLFRRLGSLQRYVADGLREPDPERAVVERLARFMDASAAVLEPDGSVAVSVGNAPFAALRLAGHAVIEAEADGWCAVAAPLAAEDAHGWLVLASPRAHFVGTFSKRAVEATAPLLVAMDQLKEVARAQELGERAALLDEALAGGDPGSLAIRAAVFGIDFTGPVRVVIGATVEGPHLRSGDVALVQGEVSGGAVGRAIESMADVPVSHRDAQLAAARGVASFEDLDLATLLLTDADPERLAPRVERIVAVLEAHPPLHEALVAYFAHDLDVPASAAELHLHPNSFRYRLSRLEELLGCSLKSPAAIAELHIALSADARTRDARF
jgi:PucR family transcriptional regulator, purine catabolism regulatory protein